MLFQEPLNAQDQQYYDAVVEKLALDKRVSVDAGAPSKVKRLHPTLKKCACGFVGTKHELYKHFDSERKDYDGVWPGFLPKDFWTKHGEVPLNEDEI